jgi:hypothetical protein
MENNMWEKWTGNRKQLSEGAKIGKTGIVTFAASEVEKSDVQEGDKYIIQRDKETFQIGIAFGNEGRSRGVSLNSDGSLTLNLRSVLASLDALPEKGVHGSCDRRGGDARYRAIEDGANDADQ